MDGAGPIPATPVAVNGANQPRIFLRRLQEPCYMALNLSFGIAFFFHYFFYLFFLPSFAQKFAFEYKNF